MMKPERKMSETEAIQILKDGNYGILSTSAQDGTPYGVPINYIYLQEDHAIYFHCAVRGRKLDNIKENDKVSFVVTGKEKIVAEKFTTHYESVIVSGTAIIITDNEEKVKRLVQLCEILTPTSVERRDEMIKKYLPAVTLVKIAIDDISGKRNQDD